MNGAATQISSREFDNDFFALPRGMQALVERKIYLMGLNLSAFPHYRMTSSNHCRLRIGDYRVIYHFDVVRNEIYLVAIGHRREIYRA